ncbi:MULTISPECIES: hypothetical protein [unclassified Candidatus Frackibacter]|uniref:hypothetical protein n=1 Tax=unclassified Candidatus Frackibacter TaxID=2648818 RepID=UPI00079AFB39|nr:MULTISPECIES: hypothetical protein [unclassified Candidatus Frackibacter]KXS45987.1 MAG: hydrogenase maturation protease [Candidatus Frackibacter sp. T328-2]SDC04006.1 Hydrogenase maturation protease [Candidatus Frackibacter sp. WG11]SEM68437.1 Hydrogenase maturation protease [Candidatus Frackibacter sp. WG12]SFL79720.1 Hydrogenase maturation protease [Candidatus Frackibacter sp. WG13]
MTYELAVIGIGDIRQQDRGVSIHLLESLQYRFNQKSVKFINGGLDGQCLFELLEDIVAKRIIVLETAETIVTPGKLNYLKITPAKARILEELLLITVEPFKTDWGTKLSYPLVKRYNLILKEIDSIIKEMLEQATS